MAMSFFVQFFERKAEDRKARAKGRIQAKHYGEALTEDEVFERSKQQQEERGLKKKVNSRKAKQGVSKPKNTDKTVDENICQGWKDSYVDDDDDNTKEFWVGCDTSGCQRWFHYCCANLRHMPDENEPFICPHCC